MKLNLIIHNKFKKKQQKQILTNYKVPDWFLMSVSHKWVNAIVYLLF